MITFSITAYQRPKEKHPEYECEDAYCFDAEVNFRFAVADTSTYGSYSPNWARLLVNEYVISGGSDFGERISMLRQRCHSSINWNGLPYYAEAKALGGDSTTFLGLSFYPAGETSGAWEAIAVGDSCLFKISQFGDMRSFPLSSTTEFNNQPPLICSVEKTAGYATPSMLGCHGTFTAGDMFIMCTDAVAKWFLMHCEAGKKPWKSLSRLARLEELGALFDKLLRHKKIEDDDFTMLVISPQNLMPVVMDCGPAFDK